MKDQFGGEVQSAVDEFGGRIVPHTEVAKNPSLMEALYPRTYQSAASGQPELKQLGATALDVSSGLLRVPGAAAAALADKVGLNYDPNIPKGPPSIYDAVIGDEFGKVPKGTTFKGALNDVNQGKNERGEPSRIANMAQDPATVPATLIGSAIPIPGKNPLLRMLGGAAAGLAQGATSAAVHQADNFTQGKEVSPADATKEAAFGGGMGLGLGALGEGIRSGGGQIIKSYLKGGHKGAAEGLDVPWFIDKEMGGSQSEMTKNAETALSGLKGSQQKIIASNARTKIKAFDILADAEKEINSAPGIAANIGDVSAAQRQLQKYSNDLIKIADPQTGEVNLAAAWAIKKKIANDASALYKAARVGGDTKKMVAQSVSALVASKLNEAMHAQVPELTALNPEFSKLIPVAKALARRNVIAGQHNPIGLDELAALEAGTNFMLHGHWEGGLLPLVQRMSKSPYAGQKLRELGGAIESPAARATLVTLPELIKGKQEGEQP